MSIEEARVTSVPSTTIERKMLGAVFEHQLGLRAVFADDVMITKCESPIGDDKDFSGKVCVKWKDTEFERQVDLRSESLIPRGDAIHAQATVSNRNAAEGALLEQPRSRQTPRKC